MRQLGLAVVFLSAVLLGGCTLLESEPPETIVGRLAQERLDLLMAYDLESSYQYTTPGYRSVKSSREYARSAAGAGMWLSANVHTVDCGDLDQPVRCDVVVFVEYKAPRLPQSETFLRETWVRTDGNWYLYQKL